MYLTQRECVKLMTKDDDTLNNNTIQICSTIQIQYTIGAPRWIFILKSASVLFDYPHGHIYEYTPLSLISKIYLQTIERQQFLQCCFCVSVRNILVVVHQVTNHFLQSKHEP